MRLTVANSTAETLIVLTKEEAIELASGKSEWNDLLIEELNKWELDVVIRISDFLQIVGVDAKTKPRGGGKLKNEKGQNKLHN